MGSLPESSLWPRRRASVVVPLVEPLRDRTVEPASAAQSEASIRVLVISDLLLGRAGLHHVLENAPGIVLVGEAGTSEEAIDIAGRERPDIVLIDLDLRADTFHCVEKIAVAAPESRMIALSDRTHAADHHDNTVRMQVGETGVVQDIGDISVFTGRNNHFDRNTYTIGSNARYFVWMNGDRTENEWRGYGQDVTGTFTR